MSAVASRFDLISQCTAEDPHGDDHGSELAEDPDERAALVVVELLVAHLAIDLGCLGDDAGEDVERVPHPVALAVGRGSSPLSVKFFPILSRVNFHGSSAGMGIS
jgi:hypothetical protein